MTQTAAAPRDAARTASPDAPRPGPRRRRRRRRRWIVGTACCLLYLVAATLIVGHPTWLGSVHAVGPWSPDVIEQIWWLQWTEYAILHGHDVFLAQWQNAPLGQNFGVNGSMLALGVILLPVTKGFGAVVSWNVLVRLAPAVNAAAMCFVLRRWVRWWPAAFAGGFLYGFSSYVMHVNADLLFLAFAPLPPVFFLLLYEGLIGQRRTPTRTGVLLGLVCALQFLVWSEYLVSMVTMGAIAVVLLVVTPLRHRLGSVRYMGRAALAAVVAGGIILVPAAAFTLFGPQNTHGSPVSTQGSSLFPNDLLASISPSSQWLTTASLTAHTLARFQFGVASYLGLPFVVVVVAFAIAFRRNRILLFCAVMAAIAFVLALGPRLVVDGHRTGVPLPFAVFPHLPVLSGFVAVRFSLYTNLFGAAVVALGMVELRTRIARWRTATSRDGAPHWRRAIATTVPVVVAALVYLPMVPANALPEHTDDTPSFFTSDDLALIPPGAVVLAYPYPDASGPSIFFQISYGIMGDQVASGMRFKILGGYGWFPSPRGKGGSTVPARLTPRVVQQYFDDAFYGYDTAVSKLAPTSPVLAGALRTFLRAHHVEAVVLKPDSGGALRVIEAVTNSIGCPISAGGMDVWLHVPDRLAASGATWGPCGLVPQLVPIVLRPADGSTVSGKVALDGSNTADVRMARLTFYLSGGGLSPRVIAEATPTIVGWVSRWDSRTVPNGIYTIRCVAVDTEGRTATSRGVTITVRNPGPGP